VSLAAGSLSSFVISWLGLNRFASELRKESEP